MELVSLSNSSNAALSSDDARTPPNRISRMILNKNHSAILDSIASNDTSAYNDSLYCIPSLLLSADLKAPKGPALGASEDGATLRFTYAEILIQSHSEQVEP